MQNTQQVQTQHETASSVARTIINETLQGYAEWIRTQILDDIARNRMYAASILAMAYSRLRTVTTLNQAYRELDSLKVYYTSLYQYDIEHGLSDDELERALKIIQYMHKQLSCLHQDTVHKYAGTVTSVTQE